MAMDLHQHDRSSAFCRNDHLVSHAVTKETKPESSGLRLRRERRMARRTRPKQLANKIPGAGSPQCKACDGGGAGRSEAGDVGVAWGLRLTHGSFSALRRIPSRVISGQALTPPSRTGSSRWASPPVR